MAVPSYVKFQRGTSAAYQTQKTNNLLDADTLYFIYESASATTGSLYLGDKLISGGVSADIPEVLTDLADLLEDAGASSFLVTDSSGEWKIATATQVAEMLNIAAGGDTLTADSNEFTSENNVLKIKGFDSASNNQVLQKVDGQLGWTNLPDLTEIETTISGLDARIADAVAAANHLSYQTASSLEAIADSAVANVVYLIPNGETEGSNKYDEYMLVNSALEKIGEFSDADLSEYVKQSELTTQLAGLATTAQLNAIDSKFDDYVTTLTFNSTVGTLVTKTELNAVDAKFADYVTTSLFNSTVGSLSDFTSYEEGVTNSIIDELNVLDARLTWKEIGA